MVCVRTISCRAGTAAGTARAERLDKPVSSPLSFVSPKLYQAPRAPFQIPAVTELQKDAGDIPISLGSQARSSTSRIIMCYEVILIAYCKRVAVGDCACCCRPAHGLVQPMQRDASGVAAAGSSPASERRGRQLSAGKAGSKRAPSRSPSAEPLLARLKRLTSLTGNGCSCSHSQKVF